MAITLDQNDRQKLVRGKWKENFVQRPISQSNVKDQTREKKSTLSKLMKEIGRNWSWGWFDGDVRKITVKHHSKASQSVSAKKLPFTRRYRAPTRNVGKQQSHFFFIRNSASDASSHSNFFQFNILLLQNHIFFVFEFMLS